MCIWKIGHGNIWELGLNSVTEVSELLHKTQPKPTFIPFYEENLRLVALQLNYLPLHWREASTEIEASLILHSLCVSETSEK